MYGLKSFSVFRWFSVFKAGSSVIFRGKAGMKVIHVTNHAHNVETATFSRDAVAGISVECMD